MSLIGGIIVLAIAIASLVLVFGLFVWAAKKDGEEDRAVQRHLGIRRRTRLPFELPEVEPVTRGRHSEELRELWEEMTEVRRSAPAGAQW